MKHLDSAFLADKNISPDVVAADPFLVVAECRQNRVLIRVRREASP